VAAPPLAASARPAALIAAPSTTVRRTPKRSAARPIMGPPSAAPSHDRDAHSDTIWRVVPSSSEICRSATIEMKGAPNVTDMMPSAVMAATHDARLSMLGARARPAATVSAISLGMDPTLIEPASTYNGQPAHSEG